jgi:short-subunit dehydrogenase
MDPRGKTVIITGASSGIGAATARVFASAGARLVLTARNGAALTALANDLPNAPLALPADIADAEAAQELVAAAQTRWGGVDIVINNAGIGLASPVAQLVPDDFEQVLATNLWGPLYTIQACLPLMQARGHGQIINVSSVVGLRALPYTGGYAASKAALDRLNEALRVELRGSGVAVTLVRPGTTHTSFRQRRLGAGHDARSVKRRGVPPEVVAGAILRAARREPRVAYVTFADRLAVLGALLLPGLADAFLGRSFAWQSAQPTPQEAEKH